MTCELCAVICLSGAAIGVCVLAALAWVRNAAYREYRAQTRWIIAQMAAGGTLT